VPADRVAAALVLGELAQALSHGVDEPRLLEEERGRVRSISTRESRLASARRASSMKGNLG